MAQRQLPVDFRDFIKSLNANKVRYLLLGGWAVGLYGNPRITKDIDFLIGIEEDNLEKVVRALSDFGLKNVEKKVLKGRGNVFRIGRSPIQIDIINQASGIKFDECYIRAEKMKLDGIRVTVISKKDLITNKSTSGRFQDLADVEFLKLLKQKSRK